MNSSTARPIPQSGDVWEHVNGGTMRVISQRGNFVRFEWVKDGKVIDKGLMLVEQFEKQTTKRVVK